MLKIAIIHKVTLLQVEVNLSQIFTMHPQNPQKRVIDSLVEILQRGGVVILPTDAGFSLCCGLDQKEAMEKIRRLRNVDKDHYFTLFCLDFSQVSLYATLNNSAFRFLKAHTPAPITFVLQATRLTPKRLMHPKRRTIGVRISDSLILRDLITKLGEPLMSVSVEQSETGHPPKDFESILEKFEECVEALVTDDLSPSIDHTTVIDLTQDVPRILRQGAYQI